MPAHRLKGFRQRRDRVRANRWHNSTSIGHLGRKPTIPPHDAANLGTNFFGVFQCLNQINAYIHLAIAAAHGQDKDQVLLTQATAL